MAEPVFVVPSDPLAPVPSLFTLERSRVEAAVGSQVEAIERVGSTAVPGLDAKLVTGVMVGVRYLRSAGSCIRPPRTHNLHLWRR